MKTTLVFLALFSLLLPISAQTRDSRHPAQAPLWLRINGAGQVALHHDGETLETGRSYVMVAVPNRGSTFLGWTRANIFTFVDHTMDESGAVTVVTYTLVSPVAPSKPNRLPVLEFTMEPEETILFDPGVALITESSGWIANFSTGSRPF